MGTVEGGWEASGEGEVVRSFRTVGQRVLVLRAHSDANVSAHGADAAPLGVNALGTVCRLRRGDYAAWVMLDARSDVPGVHPFPESDPRGRNVLALPEDCEAVK